MGSNQLADLDDSLEYIAAAAPSLSSLTLAGNPCVEAVQAEAGEVVYVL